MIHSILCFLNASKLLNVKVVPNDIFKFGGERVKTLKIELRLCTFSSEFGTDANSPSPDKTAQIYS